ncbi:hypothetical protein VTI74DRAFT_3972 [Chaetomium olivicolor]
MNARDPSRSGIRTWRQDERSRSGRPFRVLDECRRKEGHEIREIDSCRRTTKSYNRKAASDGRRFLSGLSELDQCLSCPPRVRLFVKMASGAKVSRNGRRKGRNAGDGELVGRGVSRVLGPGELMRNAVVCPTLLPAGPTRVPGNEWDPGRRSSALPLPNWPDLNPSNCGASQRQIARY